MNLNEWMTQNPKIKSPAIAAAVGCSDSYIRHLRKGSRDPSLAVARAIRKFTGGEVSEDDWPVPTSEKQSENMELADGQG